MTDSASEVWLVLSGWTGGEDGKDLVMTVTGHYYHGQERSSPWLSNFLAQQPRHLTFSAWTAQHKYMSLSQLRSQSDNTNGSFY